MKSVALRSADVTSARRFVSDLQDAISVAGAANATASPSVSAAQPQAAPAAAGSQATRTPTAAGTSATRQRQRVRDGLKLRVRSYLRSILFATWASKASAASELASSPESEEPTDPKKLDGLARQQVRELRDTAFSFGELDLARQIVRRFCDMPEVCVHVGLDTKGNKLYDLHERRVRRGNLNHMLGIFRRSEFDTRFCEATKTPNKEALRVDDGSPTVCQGAMPVRQKAEGISVRLPFTTSPSSPLPRKPPDSAGYSNRLETIAARSSRLLAAKSASGLSFDELARALGLTNTYTVQIFLGQAMITQRIAHGLREQLPQIAEDDLSAMIEQMPMRGFDERILQEPNVYRTYEAVTHYGEAIKRLINEQAWHTFPPDSPTLPAIIRRALCTIRLPTHPPPSIHPRCTSLNSSPLFPVLCNADDKTRP
ncbi:MAG: hypothetical protein SGPRY_005301 [Prymnesium sp.]